MRRAHIDHAHGSANANGQYGNTQTQMIEDENQELEDSLSKKVNVLKFFAIDIGNEVREQNKMLNNMDDDFDKSGGFLGATMKRVQMMARAGHNRYIFYLLAFCLLVFFVCWIITKSR